jgi:hypothetical protein
MPLPMPGRSPHAYQVAVDRYQTVVRAAALFVFDRLFLVAAVLSALAALACLLFRRSPA